MLAAALTEHVPSVADISIPFASGYRRRPSPGLVQVTALASTALEAEIRAKAAILSGPERASEWPPDGDVVVADDGGVEVHAPSPVLAAA